MTTMKEAAKSGQPPSGAGELPKKLTTRVAGAAQARALQIARKKRKAKAR